jgi:ABC-type glutathione transport system ATPase component
VVEQFARTALSVAASAMVMANGRIVQTGTAGDVESVLQSAYLGSAQPAEAGAPVLNGTADPTNTVTETP